MCPKTHTPTSMEDISKTEVQPTNVDFLEFDRIMERYPRYTIKPVIDSRYRAIIPWDGYLMRATSHFMERIMRKVLGLIDDGAVFGMVIDGFDHDGEKTHYELGSRNIAYTKSALARESCFNVQWVRVTFFVLVNGKVHETTEVNPEHFLGIVGDEETGYEVECFPREMERFINPKDRARWEDEAWANLDTFLYPDLYV